MPLTVKICGIKDAFALQAASEGGAAFVGFVFAPSRRRLEPHEARALCQATPPQIKKVGLFVNPTDDELDAVLSVAPLDILQLHGSEDPARLAAIKESVRLPVMKAIAITQAQDLVKARAYEPVADYLLFDAKAPQGGPAGGTGHTFDWTLLRGFTSSLPWFLAGGLCADNIAQAVTQTGARRIDLSSGVETDGVKDPQKIKEILRLAATL